VIRLRGQSLFFGAVVAFNLAFLAVPTLVIVVASFTAGEVIAFPPQGWSVRWYGVLAEQPEYWAALLRSLYVGGICTGLAVPVGVLASVALARYRVRTANLVQVYLLLPFTIPLIASGIGMMLVFGELGILGNVWPVGIATCVINIPFMIWSVAASVNRLDPDLEHAAANCGAPPLVGFVTITVPGVMPGIITGALLMFILAINEFIVSLMLVDAYTVTLPVLMYNNIRFTITPDLAAVSVVYIALAALAIWVLDRVVGLEVFLKSR